MRPNSVLTATLAAAVVIAATAVSGDSAAARGPDPVAAVGGNTSASASNYKVVATVSGACTHGQKCSNISINLTAIDEPGKNLKWHVNDQGFPFAFKVKTLPAGVTLNGSGKEGTPTGKLDGKTTTGDFSVSGEQNGKLAVPATFANAGNVTLTGTFKFAVCSTGAQSSCMPGSADLDIDVKVN